MTTVQSVLGAVDAAKLGVTLVQEHLQVGLLGWDLDPGGRGAPTLPRARAESTLARLLTVGIDTYVDATPMDLSRDGSLLVEMARQTGMNMIASTGLWHEQLGLPTYFRLRKPEELAEIFVFELEQGISGRIRCGQIAVAVGTARISEAEERVLQGAAGAQRQSGAPLLVCASGATAIPALDVLARAGGLLDRVQLALGSDSGNAMLGRSILARGAFLGFRDFCPFSPESRSLQTTAMCELIAAGYAQRILLSTGYPNTLLGRPPRQSPDLLRALNDYQPSRRLNELFATMATTAGMEHLWKQLMIINPRRYLVGEG